MKRKKQESMDRGGCKALGARILDEYIRLFTDPDTDEAEYARTRRIFLNGGLYWWFVVAEREELYERYYSLFARYGRAEDFRKEHPELVKAKPAGKGGDEK